MQSEETINSQIRLPDKVAMNTLDAAESGLAHPLLGDPSASQERSSDETRKQFQK